MFRTSGLTIYMAEKDFGLELPVTINGATFSANDALKLTVKKKPDGPAIVEKEFSTIQDNTVRFVLTASETELLPPGEYVYTLDWYQNNAFMCHIIPGAGFIVEDKA